MLGYNSPNQDKPPAVHARDHSHVAAAMQLLLLQQCQTNQELRTVLDGIFELWRIVCCNFYIRGLDQDNYRLYYQHSNQCNGHQVAAQDNDMSTHAEEIALELDRLGNSNLISGALSNGTLVNLSDTKLLSSFDSETSERIFLLRTELAAFEDCISVIQLEDDCRRSLNPEKEIELFQMFRQVTASVYRIKNAESTKREASILSQFIEHSDEYIYTFNKTSGPTVCNYGIWQNIAGNSQLPIQQAEAADNKELNANNAGYGPFGLEKYFLPSTWARLHDQLAQKLAQGRSYSIDYTIVDERNKTRWLQSKIHIAETGSDNKANAYIIYARDITQSKLAAEQAIFQAELEHWLLDKISVLFGQHNKDSVMHTFAEIGEHLKFDRIYARVFEDNGRAALFAEWTEHGIRPMSAIAPDTIPVARSPYIDQQLEAGSGIYIDDIEKADYLEQDFRQYQKNIDVRSSMIIPAMYHNKITGIVILQSRLPRQWTDTEKRIVNLLAKIIGVVVSQEGMINKLSANEKRFESAMYAAGHGFWELNLKKREVYLSSTYLSLLGYRPVSRVVPFTLDDSILHPDEVQNLRDLLQQVINGDISQYVRESRQIRRDGSIAWVLTRAEVVKWDKDGKPLILMGADIDITNLKKLETDLQIARQEADAANIAKSEFLARMSHEIRTPMNAIIGLDYLLKETSLSKTQYGYVKDIEDAAKSLLKTINGILDFSKIEAGKMHLDMHGFEIVQLSDAIYKLFSDCNTNPEVKLHVNISRSVPKWIRIDSIRLIQICENLVSNAIKFTRSGCIRVNVRYRSNSHSAEDHIQKLIVSVRDTGIGIDNKQMEFLFDAFNQGDGSSSRQHGGTGLGLTITQRLVKLMGGEIRVKSAVGKGTTVTLSVACDSIKNSTEFSEEIPRHMGRNIANLKVLLVEDNVVNQKVATGILRKKGVEVISANNGREALYLCKAVERGYLDAILMDIEMPVMNGIEATREIRALTNHKHTPIFALTAHDTQDNLQSFLDYGMNGTLTKPINPDKLYQKLIGLPHQQNHQKF